MEDVSATPGQWNQPYPLASGQTQQHELSETRLWVTLLDHEWQVCRQALVSDTSRTDWKQNISFVAPGSDVTIQRFIRPDPGNDVLYLPALADRPTMIRPFQPLTIPAGRECTIYVATTVWLRVLVGNTRSQLMEMPLVEPSMTWVGRSTMDGDLCYTAPTVARLVLEAVPRRPWRAITPVRICNRRPEPLMLERFSLPTPMLPLYRNDAGSLWTPKVTVVCETDISAARLRVSRSLPAEAGNCEMLAAPRMGSQRVSLTRALDRIFG
ncbi:MAG: hypothetical protein CL581_08035 [Alteromonadaceae bacterium]|uniref:hypothetical protein n=1 Tax=unclassified Marinobacter TaxID=83889 RepID=UPI000C4129C1|nr:hypothetical protein [Marinobacter sp. BGYM27]MAA64708.1 hypothetical protein [Alteromonadaceae bacterium]MBH84588.1 hypothetical protein [Alteromonadaceae bacterium]MDG5498216.1 hypothetical protein [Marinobacter sp. BGYM27]|tara:strand:- start:21119 stop:21922 length:804 start_codon:yes stop_codon:yes gene_type:complete